MQHISQLEDFISFIKMCFILNYSMPFGNIKRLCYPLWIFETRIAIIIIMVNQQHHRDYEEDITIFDIIDTITQL